MPQSIFSYVVRYDSGFAPNPFFGYCTLATCKPTIRKSACVGDWIIGTGSAAKGIRRGGFIVHAMQVTEVLSTSQYWNDERFEKKKPILTGSWMHASGDNIYSPKGLNGWNQLNSYHSSQDGSAKVDHIARDTGVQRILVSDRFLYCGAEGPRLPEQFQPAGKFQVVKAGIGYSRGKSPAVINELEKWFDGLPRRGFIGKPWDWVNRK